MAKWAVIALTASIAASGGCDRNQAAFNLQTAPSATPSPSPPVPAPAAPTGTIALKSVSPGFGATLPVRNCGPGAVAGSTRICTDQLNATFEIELDVRIETPVLAVGFYDGDIQCGVGVMVPEVIEAHRPTAVDVSLVYLSFDQYLPLPVTVVQPCSLPATTTRIVARLGSQATHTELVAAEFQGTYTFVP